MGYMDWDAIEAQKLAEDQAGVRRWSEPWETPDRGVGRMEQPPDPEENYGLLEHLANAIREHYATQAEQKQRHMASIGSWLEGGAQGPLDPQMMNEITNDAMNFAMGTVRGPAGGFRGGKTLAQEGDMLARARGGQLKRQARSAWADPESGLGAGLDDLIASQERGGTPAGPKLKYTADIPLEKQQYNFEGWDPAELAQHRKMFNLRKEMGKLTRDVPEETPLSDLNKMYTEGPKMQDTRLRNFILKEGGVPYQHPMPYPMSNLEATAQGQRGLNLDALKLPESPLPYSIVDYLKAAGSGLKGGAEALIEDYPSVTAILDRMRGAVPSLSPRGQAFVNEHPLSIAGGAAAGAAGAGMYSAMPEGGMSMAPPEYVTDPEGANARARQSLAEKALQAAAALKQRAAKPYWGMTPEEFQAATEHIGSLLRDPFRRTAGR